MSTWPNQQLLDSLLQEVCVNKAAKSKFCNAAIILDSESNLQDVIREACQN